jgi:hypothetical protein
MMDEGSVAYIIFSMIVPLAAFAFLPQIGTGIFGIVAVILILVGVGAILLMNWADFILFPLVTYLFNITFQPAAGYKIIKTQDAVVKDVNGLFYATGYLSANLFPYVFRQEVQGTSDELKMLSAPETWERCLMSLGFPFKFHVLSSGLDVEKVREELEGKRSYQEFQMSRALQSGTANDVGITEMQRKISILQTQIDRISQGEKPIATAMYVETTAIGVSEKAALDALSAQVKGLQLSLGALDVDLVRIVGRELHTLFSFNFGLPTSLEEIGSYFNQQS